MGSPDRARADGTGGAEAPEVLGCTSVDRPGDLRGGAGRRNRENWMWGVWWLGGLGELEDEWFFLGRTGVERWRESEGGLMSVGWLPRLLVHIR